MTFRNIVVMLTDDHAQWALGTYGNGGIRSPTIDHLAKTGVQFDNSFTPIPVCSPARASFWTGKMPSQHGMHDYLNDSDPEVAAVSWLKDEKILANRLKEAGYTTAMVGKWHVGLQTREEAGFDYWFSQYGPAPVPTDFDSDIEPPTPPNGNTTDRHAINFLRRREPDKPFFLFVGHFATHSPWVKQPERLVEHYRAGTFEDIPRDPTYPFGRLTAEAVYATRSEPNEAAAQYYASVTLIDEQVGRLIDELEAQGLRDSTTIVYTADHGLNTGHHGLWGKGNATYPYNLLEESIRIPMIINGPGQVLGHQHRAEVATLCDLHATVLEIAGVEIPEAERDQLRLPGKSLLPLCRGEAAVDWPDAVFGEYGDLRMIRSARYKLVKRYGSSPGEFFDLQSDPRERVNLINIPEHATLITELDQRLEAYFAVHSEPAASGLRVRELPRHNSDEAWREDGVHRLVASADWMLEAGGIGSREP